MQLPQMPTNPYQQTPVPEGMPKVSHMCLVVGSPGSGKTYSTCQLLKAYKQAGVYNRIYAYTPTYWTNQYLFEDAGVNPEDAFTGLEQGSLVLDEIMRRIQRDHNAYKTNQSHWEAWRKRKEGEGLSPHEQQLIEMLGEPTVHLDIPRPALVCDDIQATKMTHSRKFASMAVRRRHVCHTPQVELSIYLISQSLKNGAVPRSLRGICDLALLYPSRDRTVLKDFWGELSSRCTWPEFQAMFDACCTGDDRPYLVVDLTHGFDPQRTFRRKLDGPWIDPQGFASAQQG